jgi:spermidine synthase
MKNRLHQYFPEWFALEKVTTFYNQLEVIGQKGKLVLNAPHVNYSFGTLHEVFSSAFRQLSPDFNRIDSVLILGFGAGSVAHILQNENQCNCSVTGVEIDEKVIALAKKYFRLDELQHLELHIADAAEFLHRHNTTYPLVVVDIFLDHRLPGKFQTPAFMKSLHNHVQSDGTVLFNYLLYDYQAKQDYVLFEKTFRGLFKEVNTLTFKNHRKNVVFVGRK